VGPWLQQAYGPAWQEATAAAGRDSTSAHKAAVAVLEQRHAALLKVRWTTAGMMQRQQIYLPAAGLTLSSKRKVVLLLLLQSGLPAGAGCGCCFWTEGGFQHTSLRCKMVLVAWGVMGQLALMPARKCSAVNCLQDIGSSRELTLKRILQLVQTFSADVTAQLVRYQQAELCAQQQHLDRLTAAAAAAVHSTISGAVQAANNKHQDQVRHSYKCFVFEIIVACSRV
jgi:hypothetical protein